MAWFRNRRRAVPTPVLENISTIAQLESELRQARSRLDRASDAVSNFAGSLPFIFAHMIIFACWIVLNSAAIMGKWVFDPYPFIFLNFVLAVEAVLLGTFVLMSQNRQNRQADHWAHLNLQIALLSERENTKMLHMILRICEHLELDGFRKDRELLEMLDRTHLPSLAEQLKQARES